MLVGDTPMFAVMVAYTLRYMCVSDQQKSLIPVGNEAVGNEGELKFTNYTQRHKLRTAYSTNDCRVKWVAIS